MQNLRRLRDWSKRLSEPLAGGLPMMVAAPVVVDSDILVTILGLVLVVISLSIHEAAHAWAALKCGDSTAKDLGRLTLNPIVHIDPFRTILLPLLLALAQQPTFGGAK